MSSQAKLNTIGATVLVLILGVGTWWIVSGDSSGEQQPQPSPSQSVPTDVMNPSVSPSIGTADTRMKSVSSTIRNFVSAYYARDTTITREVMTERLRPLVTQRFMREFFPDLSRDGDPWFRTGDGAVIATGSAYPTDYSEVPDTVPATTQVFQRQVSGEDGLQSGYSFTVTIELTWSDGWRVSSFI